MLTFFTEGGLTTIFTLGLIALFDADVVDEILDFDLLLPGVAGDATEECFIVEEVEVDGFAEDGTKE